MVENAGFSDPDDFQSQNTKAPRAGGPFCCALLVAAGVEGGQRAHPTAGNKLVELNMAFLTTNASIFIVKTVCL